MTALVVRRHLAGESSDSAARPKCFVLQVVGRDEIDFHGLP
jgi:hypothetical protein